MRLFPNSSSILQEILGEDVCLTLHHASRSNRAETPALAIRFQDPCLSTGLYGSSCQWVSWAHCSTIFLSCLAAHARELFSPCFPCSYEHTHSWLSPFSLAFYLLLLIRTPQKTTLPSCIFFSLGWYWSLPTIQCYESLSIVLQALYLPDLIL